MTARQEPRPTKLWHGLGWEVGRASSRAVELNNPFAPARQEPRPTGLNLTVRLKRLDWFGFYGNFSA